MLFPTVKRFGAALAPLVLLSGPATSHAAFVDVAPVDAVSVTARYDTGEPMANAQVTVFAPDNPAQPWAIAQTDAAGRYVFVPADQSGQWAIQVRQAGHGAMRYLEVGTDAAVSLSAPPAAASGLSLMQRLLMVACVGWGSVGTALYFRRSTRRARA